LTGFSDEPEHQRAINLPPATAVLAGLLIAIHLVRQILSPETDDSLVLNFALIPVRLTEMPLSFQSAITVLTHMFLHASWLHLLVNTGMMLAFAAGLERLTGTVRMLGIALFSGLAAGLLHLAVYAHDANPMLGASGAISGMFGAMILLLSQRQRGYRFLLGVSALWLTMNVVLGVAGMPSTADEQPVEIAWVAHLGGYIAGVAAMAVLAFAEKRRRTAWKRYDRR
jgi:membrane associated rhomboid family serine protease